MKKKYLKILLILLTFATITACSKEDSTKPPIDLIGGEVYLSQVVTISLPSTDLTEQEYQATLDGVDVTLVKSDDHKLLFLVPNDAILGAHTLTIPSLNNATISYDIKETVLSEAPEASLAPFFANFTTFSMSLDASPEAVEAQDALDNFNNYFANATVAEKTEIAILYQVNKTVFDSIILDTSPGRSIDTNALYFGAAVIGVGASIPLLLAPTGATQIAGLVLIIPSLYYAKKYGKPLYNEYILTGNIKLDGILGTNERAGFIPFEDNINSSLTINTLKRKLMSADEDNPQSSVVYFFKYINILNGYINKANTTIQIVNNLPFVNFSLIPLVQLSTSGTEVNGIVNSIDFDNITFSVNNANLQLVSSTFQSAGNLNMKIKIIGTPTVLPVQSTLNYSYTDNFSSFSGTIPIEVSEVSSGCGTVTDIDGNVYQTITIGTQCWMVGNLKVTKYQNGDPIPNITDNNTWGNLPTAAYCNYNNNVSNGSTYGRLYNWFAVNDSRNIAPVGWHVATLAEFATLESYLGGSSIAGGEMKASSSDTPGWDGTNSSGFTALPAGYRYHVSGLFATLGTSAAFWTTTEYSALFAWNKYLNTSDVVSSSSPPSKTQGFSVRCLKD